MYCVITNGIKISSSKVDDFFKRISNISVACFTLKNESCSPLMINLLDIENQKDEINNPVNSGLRVKLFF